MSSEPPQTDHSPAVDPPAPVAADSPAPPVDKTSAESDTVQASKDTQKTESSSSQPAAAPNQPESAQASAPPSQKEQTPATPASAETANLSPAELKKLAKAEKAARRAKVKADKEGPATPGGSGPLPKKGAAPSGQKDARAGQRDQKSTTQQGGPHDKGQKHTGSGTAASSSKALPVRNKAPSGGPVKEIKTETKEVALFGHLYSQPRRHVIDGAPKEVHPAVLALGLQMSNYVICGSTARCVAMLLAFKKVIESYITPPGTSLARHLTSHHLSPQIEYLKSCRPISISQGNAIRWLKDIIIKIDPSVPESTAKSELIESIDEFIRERITAADTLIAQTASSKIVSGDTILTYASSSIVRQTLLKAHAAGTRFKVIIVDTKPLYEGRRLARILASKGLDIEYAMVSAASHAVRNATKVFLGAHAMMSNGRLYSRVGTAIVAMLAHQRDIPVIVCCESIKFTDRVALDSIVVNEIAPAEELLGEAERATLAAMSSQNSMEDEKPKSGGKDAKEAAANGAGYNEEKAKLELLSQWRDTPRLQMLNILYDVTPAEYIKMVVTEFGSLPPSSVPVVHRISTNA